MKHLCILFSFWFLFMVLVAITGGVAGYFTNMLSACGDSDWGLFVAGISATASLTLTAILMFASVDHSE